MAFERPLDLTHRHGLPELLDAMTKPRTTKKKASKASNDQDGNSPVIRPDYRLNDFVAGCLNPVNQMPTLASIIRLGAQDRYKEALAAAVRLGGERSLDTSVRLLTAGLY